MRQVGHGARGGRRQQSRGVRAQRGTPTGIAQQRLNRLGEALRRQRPLIQHNGRVLSGECTRVEKLMRTRASAR